MSVRGEHRWPAVAALIVAVAAVHANALATPFQFDDWWAIVGETRVHSLAAWWKALPGIRPLLKFAHALNWTLAPTPFAFHAVNLAIHAANTLLLWALLRRWLPALAPSLARPRDAAFAAALVFALHPVATEVVAYASGRSISLAALFQLAALLALSRDGWRVQVIAALCFAAALAVRETAVTLPLAWLLLARCGGLAWRDALRPLAGIAVVLAVAIIAALATPGYHSFFGWSLQTRGLDAQLLGQLEAHAYLLANPLPALQMDIDPDVRVPAAFALRHALLLLAFVATAALAWSQRRTRPWLLFALGWYLLHLAPSNSLLPRFDLANDRHLYLALIGPVLVVAVVACTWRHRIASFALLAILAALLAMQTVRRNHDYRSELALWQATVATAPAKARPWTNLGFARQQAGDDAGAAAAYRCAIALDPDYRQAGWNLAALAPLAGPRDPHCPAVP